MQTLTRESTKKDIGRQRLMTTSLFAFSWTSRTSVDDQTIARIGPLSLDEVAQLEAGELSLEIWRFGVFRHRAIRRAFERFQGPTCRRRALGYCVAFNAFQIFLGILKVAEFSIADPAMIVSGPLWYSMIVYAYIFACAVLIYAIPKLARGRLEFLSNPRCVDLVLAACVLGYLLMVPRLYSDDEQMEKASRNDHQLTLLRLNEVKA